MMIEKFQFVQTCLLIVCFNLHRLLLITIKRATMCMNQQRIKRRDMRVDGLVIELHATSRDAGRSIIGGGTYSYIRVMPN